MFPHFIPAPCFHPSSRLCRESKIFAPQSVEQSGVRSVSGPPVRTLKCVCNRRFRPAASKRRGALISGSVSCLLQGVSVIEVRYSDEEVLITEEREGRKKKGLGGFEWLQKHKETMLTVSCAGCDCVHADKVPNPFYFWGFKNTSV